MEHQLELPDFRPRRRSNVLDITDRLKEREEASAADASLDDLIAAHEYERRRLGQELHDSTGQLLMSLQFSLSRLRQIAERPDETSLIEEISDTVGQIGQEIRSLAFMDYPVELGDRDLFSAVRLLVLGFARRSGIRTSFKASGEEWPVARDLSMSMLRVVQEALVNIHRHAKAKTARVLLDRRPQSLQLTISDDGIGMPAASLGLHPQGIGVQGMRHRVETLGGRFRMVNLAHGMKLTATVPLRA